MISRTVKMLILFALPLQLTSCDHQAPASNTQVVESAPRTPTPVPDLPAAELPAPAALPRLVDLGASRCVPCRMMAPILDALREEYRDTVSVEFIDVTVHPDQGDAHGVQLIPTQVFFDASGNEVARHVGFMSREAILAQFEAMGISAPPTQGE